MTAPVGDDPTWLDDLERAHAAATPGEWAQHPADPTYVIGDISDGGESYLDVADAVAGGLAAAALIVAAVNAVPDLIRLAREREALREKVETVAAWCEEQAASRTHFAKVDPAYRDTVIPYEAAADRLRAALTPESVPT